MTSSNGNISAFLAIFRGNSPITGEFPTQKPVTRSFDVFHDLRQNKRWNKQSWVWWFETPSRPLWRHSNVCLNFQRIHIHFTDMAIEGHSSCNYDSLKVYDGDHVDAPLLGIYCGDTLVRRIRAHLSIKMIFSVKGITTGLNIGLQPANERRRCFVTTSLVGWVQA